MLNTCRYAYLPLSVYFLDAFRLFASINCVWLWGEATALVAYLISFKPVTKTNKTISITWRKLWWGGDDFTMLLLFQLFQHFTMLLLCSSGVKQKIMRIQVKSLSNSQKYHLSYFDYGWFWVFQNPLISREWMWERGQRWTGRPD